MTMTVAGPTANSVANVFEAEGSAPTHAASTHGAKAGIEALADATGNPFAATLAAMLMPAHLAAPASAEPTDAAGIDSELSKVIAPLGRAQHDKVAFASAAGARAAANAAAVTTANNDVEALNPEFRTRLSRVINRMHDEFGHDVAVVEGFRSQVRQNYLYEQGRTRPGEVVTWTKSSKHTLGMAVDVVIDGSYNNPLAYQRLAQIAAQEGLRTLGARDPGHLELPSRAGAAAWGTMAPSDSASVESTVSRAVGLVSATLSKGIAANSDATGHADIAMAVTPHAADRDSVAAVKMPVTMPVGAHTNAQTGGNMGGQMGSHQHDAHREGHADMAKAMKVSPVAEVAQPARIAEVAQIAQVAHVATPTTLSQASSTVNHVAAPDRVGQVLDVRDASPARPLSHVTLAVENSAGGTDHIRVDVRGAAVHTAISVGDQAGADKMALRVGQLQTALEQQGLEAGSIRVNSSSASADTGAGWTPRHGSDSSSQHDERPSSNHRDSLRQDAEESRHRSRRGAKGEK